MAEGHTKQLLEKEVTCSLCSNYFKKPKKLICGHVFCKECLMNLTKPGGLITSISCPECLTISEVPSNDISNFPTALLIKALVKALQSQQVQSAYRSPVDSTSNKFCSDHPTKIIQDYCEMCNKLLCQECLVAQNNVHSDHNFAPLVEMSKQYQKELHVELTAVEQLQGKISTALKQLPKAKVDLEVEEKACLSQIEEKFDALFFTLHQEKTKLKTSLSQLCSQEFELISSQKEALVNLQRETQRITDSIRMICEGSTDNVLLSKETAVKSAKQLQVKVEQHKIHLNTMTIRRPHIALNIMSSTDLQEAMKRIHQLYPLADPRRSYFDGTLLQNANFGTTCSVSLHLFDSRGEGCSGAQKVEVSLQCVRDDFVTTGVQKNESLSFEFTLERRGRHMLNVKVNGVHIDKSPCNVFVHKSVGDMNRIVHTVSNLQCPNGLAIENGKVVATEGAKNRLIEIDSRFQYHERCCLQISPSKIVIDTKNSNIYVTSTSEHKLHKFNGNGEIICSIGKQGFGEKEFRSPNGLRISKKDELYICDQGNDRIQVFDLNLNFKRLLGSLRDKSQVAHFHSPCDIDFDVSGNILYVADSKNNRIQVFTSDELLSHTIKCDHLSQGLYIYNDSILVTTSSYPSVHIYSLSGKHCVSVCYYNTYYCSSSAVVDDDGFLYVTFPNNNTICVL